MTDTFTLSIEDTPGHSFQYGFHLGTIETVARQCAVDIYNNRANNGLPVVTVALMRKGRMFACYGGEWFGETWSPEREQEWSRDHGW